MMNYAITIFILYFYYVMIDPIFVAVKCKLRARRCKRRALHISAESSTDQRVSAAAGNPPINTAVTDIVKRHAFPSWAIRPKTVLNVGRDEMETEPWI
ncbi:hypothetical protein CHELA40_11601 [Chelatococcus asaccharovorans]|nr:hypothetical protein CHELA40_11601 [Chelatococcus asaccharovorans]CAH1684439.1 hypothetical protein CHELA17_64000 [Chelatococcus asaccharovorans]